MIDKNSVTHVCIDDFALKKRKSYGTIMIDIKTHRILDLIESREYEDICQWLKTYPNLQVVSRDGSITYHNAIADTHPKVVQVSDRFHLLKNLTSYAIDYLKKELKTHIIIPVPNQEDEPIKELQPVSKAAENRKLTLKEKYSEIEQMLLAGDCKTKICQNLNMDVRVYDKLINMSPKDRDSSFQTKMMVEHEEKVRLKMECVNEVREFKRIGCSNREISRRTGLAPATIRIYLDKNFDPVHAAYGKKKNGLLIPYIKEIDSFLEQGLMGSVIEKKIQEMGYDGSRSTVRHYIADWKKRRKFSYDKSKETKSKTETIERKDVFKLLFQAIEKVKAISQGQFERLCSQSQSFEKIYNIIWEFKNLLATKNVKTLSEWMAEAKNLKIREINSFVNGLERDLDAVKNAIEYEYNNGLAEGSINKLKVIKRTMFGRCSFEMLRIKTLQLEEIRRIN